MNRLKLSYLLICIPFISYGQCIEGESFLEISTNGDSWSIIDNIVSIASSDLAFYESFLMSSGNVDNDYCLDPGNYTFEITDDWGDGIGCNWNGGGNNHIRIWLDEELIFELDCPNINSYWSSQSGNFTVEELIILGCMDDNASNYNPDANYDDNSCEYSGCTDLSYIEAHNYEVTPFGYQILPYDPNYIYATIDDGSCENLMVWGCTDSNYFEYDSMANISSNDMCITLIIEGCDDLNACNYDVEVNFNNNTCIYALEYYDCDFNCLNDEDSDGICNEYEIEGCISNSSACNYNIDATDIVPCEFANEFYNCSDVCINDYDSDGVCDELEISGCTEITACNYNPYATDDNGSCESLSCYGCIDTDACNYNSMTLYPTQNCIYASDIGNCASCSGETDGSGIILNNDVDNDGICDDDEIDGCMVDSACNFNINATNEDGSCEFISCIGCIELNACNYDSEATLSDQSCIFPETYYDCNGICIQDDDFDGICNELEIVGCLDNIACNYNPNSTDESECIFPILFYDCNGICLNDINNNLICDELEVYGCIDTEACNYNSDANVSDSSCEFSEEYYDCYGNCTNDSNLNGICDELEILGCIEPDACNYDSGANVNDGNCEFPIDYYDCYGNCINDSNLNGICDELEGGCTDSLACNYNANAIIDNGTCEYLEVMVNYNNVSFLLEASSNAELVTYQWNVNGENTNINTDRLNPFVNGIYTVTIYDEENDCWGEASYTIIDFTINLVKYEINIFPNPVDNILCINSNINIQNTSIEIYNYVGKLIKTFQIKNSKHTQTDVSKLSSGIYIIKIKSEDFLIQKEFFKY